MCRLVRSEIRMFQHLELKASLSTKMELSV